MARQGVLLEKSLAERVARRTQPRDTSTSVPTLPSNIGPIYFELAEDVAGSQVNAWRVDWEGNRVLDDPFLLRNWETTNFGTVVGIISGAKAGYRGKCDWTNGEWSFTAGGCIDECESSGSITVPSMPDGTEGVAYPTTTLTTSGLDAAPTTTDTVPGLTFTANGNDVDVSGTPTTAGTYYLNFSGQADKTGPGDVDPGEKCTITVLVKIVIEAAP